MLSFEVGVRTFMPHPSAGSKEASFLCKPKTAVLPVELGSTPQWRTVVLAAADPSGSVGLVEVGFFSVKSSGTALGKILGRPAQTVIATGSDVLWVKNRVFRRARVALLIQLRAHGAYKDSGALMSSPLQENRPLPQRRQERPLRAALR